MTTEITFRPGIEGLMAALSVAEKLTATTPVLPHHLSIEPNEFDYVPGTFERPMGVVLYFHLAPESVAAFAGALGVEVREQTREGQWTLYTHADGSLDGVPFRAWALTNPATAQDVDETPSAVAA